VPKEHLRDRAGTSASVLPEEEALVNEHFTERGTGSGNEGPLSAAVPTAAPSGGPLQSSTDALSGPGISAMETNAMFRTMDRPSVSVQDTTSYYTPEKHRWNAKAIASLPIAIATVVVGIASQSIFILLAGGVVAFVLGLISARQCRDREDRGKGFALAAMILGGAAMFFSIMVIIWAA